MMSKHNVQGSEVHRSLLGRFIPLRVPRSAFIFLLLLILGVLFSWWMAARTDREMRAGLLVQARLVAQAVNIERVTALTGTKADLESPDYRQIKNQLATIRSANPQSRFIYLLGRKADGTVFFFLDSEPDNSKDYSPPGEIYADIPASYRRVFDTKEEVVEGPVTDRWGTWVSALVPINNTATASSGLVNENDAQAMVRKAVDFYRKNGRERLLKELNNPQGEFRKGELYAFAYDRNMTMQAHPVKPELVGQNLLEKKDWGGGKYFRKEIQQVAFSKGSGWVDYQYENPVNKMIMPKTTYVQRVDDLIVCAGAYKSTGKLLAVLGMDIDARAWKWDLASKAALPVGMMLVLFIGAATIFFSTRSVDASPKLILRRLLPPLSAMLILLISGTGALLWQQHQQRIAGDTASIITETKDLFRVSLDQQVIGLAATLQPIAADPAVQKALRKGDADRLLAVWRPVFKKLHLENNLTHFYFLDTNRVCLLRVHKPEKRGDVINRFTALEAERTGKTASGIELGPLGTFTLRVVKPVFEGGKLVGYVELGKEIEDVLQTLHTRLGVQIAATIRKEHLNRQIWEDGMRMLGREADWNRLPKSVVIYSSQRRLPDTFSSWIESLDKEHVHGETNREITFGGKNWQVFAITIRDVSGKEVGDLLLMIDVSPEKATFARLIALGGTAGGLLLTLLIGFVYVLLRRTDTSIKAQQAEIRKNEVKYRLLVENINETMLVIQDGLIKYANNQAAESFGYSEQEVMSINIFELIHPEDREEVTKRYLQKIKGDKTPTHHTHRTIHKSGQIKWVEVSSVLIDWKGRPATLNFIMDISIRKQAQKELMDREERYKYLSNQLETILDHIPGLVFYKDTKNNYIRVNKYIALSHGMTKEELEGKSLFDLYPKEDAEKYYQDDLTVIDSGVSKLNIEEQWHTTEGIKWVVTSKIPFVDATGEIIGIIGFAFDITERKRTEEKLHESEELFRNYLENAPDGIYMSDLEGNFLYGNRKCEEIVGYRREELIGKNFLELNLLSENSLNRAIQLLQANMEGKSTGPDEIELISKEGRLIPIEINTSMFNRMGKKIVLAFVRDITERKRAVEKLRESEERIHAITDSAHDAILMMDNDGNVSYWNNSAERILGYTSAEAIGRNLHELIAPERFVPAHLSAFPEFLQTGRGSAVGKKLELAARRKDGQEIEVALSLSSVKIKGAWHGIGIMQDISDRKQAEAELLEINRQLEEATAEAKMANVAKSEFLANMSHEIRTPMNGVIGMTGLLLDTDLSDEQRKYAEIVRNSGESLMVILNDILDFSKIEAGKLEMEALDFDLRVLLDDFAATMAMRAHDKGLEFICAAAPDVPAYLCGDPGRLRQILTNLTGNALKFTHKGEIAVRASLVSETDTEVVMRFSVKDTGIGIPANKQELMFQKFTQADASTTRQYGGTGLGLAISKQLAEQMGGKIGVISKEGYGSELWFTARLGKQAGGAKKEIHPPADIRGAHILVVDDNATNREVLINQFAAWGVRSEDTPDGATALQALYRARDTGDPFRAAILDMQMPIMDGAELAQAIKADETLKDIRLVLMTSLGQRGDARKMEQIGFDAYLVKPARQSELFDCLSTVLADTVVPQPERPINTRHMIHEIRRGAERILLAEDNITNQQVALGILKKLGLRADAVANGVEAVNALKTLPYDLVLMDVQMPVMDGLQATRQIRNPQSAVRNHRIPIIAMTAHAMQGDREKCLEAGMNDYITKPVDPQALAEALEKWLPKEGKDKYSKKEEDEYPITNTQYSTNESLDVGYSKLPVFDRAGMLDRMMGDEDLARMVTETFLDDAPKQIEALRGFLAAGDVSGTERQAHTIKGAAANIGGEALRELAFKMEKTARAGNLDEVRDRLPEMITQFELLREEIGKSGL